MTSPQAQATADAAGRHEPVLLQRCLDLLAPAIEGAPARPVMIDCTLGMGGHSEAALESFPRLRVVGIDRDPEAIALASARLERFGDRFVAVQTTYDAVNRVAREHSVSADRTVDAVLMDLGVSSLQLDEASRGFSYARPAPLDMRMDQGSGTTAQELLETSGAAELTHILRTYGEERFASRIAAAIVRRREAGEPVASTQDLAELVRQAVPAAARRSGGHPAKRTFQALRIAVNAELDVLERAVPLALNSLRVGGRLVVESYQSLEDRIVKRALNHGATSRAPQDLPVVPEADRPYLELLTNGAEKADARELDHNPRSAPVRLRAAARIRPVDQAPAPEAGPVPNAGRSPRPGRKPGLRPGRHRPT
ncbi:16S rRNA (cytosine(1402)-N(4))-methyltransferase RsmH [Actinomyces viscosus]|uniref:Ribosomal RNA small subunit methyltransferase H n=2 Tax=Actinomyces viscosus TaxID=1656 RepID=A0A448PJW3_ACTVI|nr:16S rRNA (cytosine(1402)-N(4))-methyltransferase RsmH [Actinomyces viscosus]TFH54109.1 16S rRNA (cytosine(1402)-N(4))-methyltransferase RsmH [Actinomyces viscosus]VEI15299.1 Ribosomal RNA small subunit methyltransferase H [Actinomyces viscosus]